MYTKHLTLLLITQKELADRSELDRTYISMVENEKQNLTLGAMVKMSSALEAPFASLGRRSLT
jgi:transcriptional regulator with XRE-family HTH domain